MIDYRAALNASKQAQQAPRREQVKRSLYHRLHATSQEQARQREKDQAWQAFRRYVQAQQAQAPTQAPDPAPRAPMQVPSWFLRNPFKRSPAQGTQDTSNRNIVSLALSLGLVGALVLATTLTCCAFLYHAMRSPCAQGQVPQVLVQVAPQAPAATMPTDRPGTVEDTPRVKRVCYSGGTLYVYPRQAVTAALRGERGPEDWR